MKKSNMGKVAVVSLPATEAYSVVEGSLEVSWVCRKLELSYLFLAPLEMVVKSWEFNILLSVK